MTLNAVGAPLTWSARAARPHDLRLGEEPRARPRPRGDAGEPRVARFGKRLLALPQGEGCWGYVEGHGWVRLSGRRRGVNEWFALAGGAWERLA